MSNFLFKALFSATKRMNYQTLCKLSRPFGFTPTKQNYEMIKNMSYDDFVRSMSLVKSGSQMHQVQVPVTVDLNNPKVLDGRTLKNVVNANTRYIGVSADFIPEELKDPAILPLITENFNSFTFTNSMKWNKLLVKENGDYETYDFEAVDKVLDVLHQNGIRVRGHNLFWGKFVGMTFPSSVKQAVEESADPEGKLKEIIDRHLTKVLTHFKGKVQQWDVINETIPYSAEFKFDGYFYDVLGEDYIPYILRKAKEIDPDVELYLNEAIGDFGGNKGKDYLAWLKKLVDDGVPLDGIGIQGHIGKGKWDIAGFDSFAGKLEKLGLSFEITELDMSAAALKENANPLMSQAQYIYDLVRVALAHKNCHGITFWGLRDNANWYDSIKPYSNFAPNRPNPFTENLEKKPMYYAVKKAFLEQQSED